MFSATRLVVAAAIVALFGGFLLAGLLTTQPSDEAAPAATPSGLGTFRPAGSMPEARFGHSATRLVDGRVLVVGGHPDTDPYGPTEKAMAQALIWDPVTESFSPAGILEVARSGHSAVLLLDGRVLVAGGWDYGECEGYCVDLVAGAEAWDPTTESFSPAGTLADPRDGHSAVLLSDGRALIVGGAADDRPARAAEVWDPGTGSFGPAGSLARVRYDPVVESLPDGRVFVVGVDSQSLGVEASAEVWDPRSSTFAMAASFDPRHEGLPLAGYSSTRLPDGGLLIVGGEYDDDPSEARDEFRHVATAMIWDPESGRTRPAGQLAQERAHHTASLLPDGRVLTFGGRLGPEHRGFASAELWDPATDSFAAAGSLAERRWGHTTTLLDDGRILVLGGVGDDGYLASAEVWEPGDSQPEGETTEDAITPDLLPGVDLVTEEVEPGVFRVVSDGAGHDLVGDPPVSVTVAPDGSVVLFGADPAMPGYARIETVYVLGAEPSWDAWAEISGSGPPEAFWFDAVVDHAGSLWARLEAGWSEGGGRLGRHDGLFGQVDTDAWTLPTWPDGSDAVRGIEVTASTSMLRSRRSSPASAADHRDAVKVPMAAWGRTRSRSFHRVGEGQRRPRRASA